MNWICLLIFAFFSIAAVVKDIRELMIPDWTIIAGSAALLAYQALFARGLIVQGLLGAALSPLLFYAVRRITNFGMGLGDVKYSILCGLCAGANLAFLSYAVASLICALYFASKYLLDKKTGKKNGRKAKIPFAPFMAAGILAVCTAARASSFV